jgi:hypothetical protein
VLSLVTRIWGSRPLLAVGDAGLDGLVGAAPAFGYQDVVARSPSAASSSFHRTPTLVAGRRWLRVDESGAPLISCSAASTPCGTAGAPQQRTWTWRSGEHAVTILRPWFCGRQGAMLPRTACISLTGHRCDAAARANVGRNELSSTATQQRHCSPRRPSSGREALQTGGGAKLGVASHTYRPLRHMRVVGGAIELAARRTLAWMDPSPALAVLIKPYCGAR